MREATLWPGSAAVSVSHKLLDSVVQATPDWIYTL